MKPVCRGTRSKDDSKLWICDTCKRVNNPFKLKFFDVPRLKCACGNKFPLDFKFNLRTIMLNGYRIIRYVKRQTGPTCLANAYTSAVEIKKRIKAVRKKRDPDKLPELDARNLWGNVQEKYPDHPVTKMRPSQKVVHLGLMLKSKGVKALNRKKYYKVSDVSTIACNDVQTMLNAIADGEPLVAGIRSGKKLGKLKWCQIYKAPSTEKHRKKNGKIKSHAVVFIGGGMQKGFLFFFFLNSWGKTFCIRRFLKQRNWYGVGKVRIGDLTRSVVMLSSQDAAGTRSFREEHGTTPKISAYNRSLVIGAASAVKESYHSEQESYDLEVEDDGDEQEVAEEEQKNWNQLLDGKRTYLVPPREHRVLNDVLRCHHAAPSSLPILSRALTLAERMKPKDAVVASLSSLPDEVVDIFGTVSPSEYSVSERRRKLEFLEMQEELIKEEEKKKEKEEKAKQKKEEKANLKEQESAEEDFALKEVTEPTAREEEVIEAKQHDKEQLCNVSRALASPSVDAMLKELEKEIDDVDAQIGNRWQLLDRDHDDKVTPDEVAMAAAYIKDTIGKEGVQELSSNLSKAKEGKICVEDIVKLASQTEENNEDDEPFKTFEDFFVC